MARILARHDALLPREYRPGAPAPLRLLARLMGGGAGVTKLLPVGERLALAFEQMGPSAIKLGQFLATRPDLDRQRNRARTGNAAGPAAAISRRRGGKDRRTFAWTAAGDRIFGIRRAGGGRIDRAGPHGGHDRRSAAAGCGENPAAGNRGGISTRFCGLLARRRNCRATFPEARRLRLGAVVDTLAASVALELDLRMEAAAASELAHNTRDDDDFRVPHARLDAHRGARFSRREWVDGVVLRDAATLARPVTIPSASRWWWCAVS